MSIGMTYKEFYEEDPRIVRAYQEAERLRTAKQSKLTWVQGIYFYNAISTGLANFGAGLGGKVGKAQYIKEPIRLTPKTEKEIEAERQKQLRAYIEELKNFQRAFNRRKEQNDGFRSSGVGT